MSADRPTVGELLADSDAIARDTLLDVAADRSPGMVRTWPQLVQAAGRLWTALPAAGPVETDPLVRLAAVSSGIGRSVAAGQWPGPGPTEDRLGEIVANLTRADQLTRRLTAGLHPAGAELRGDAAAIRASVLHTLYVAGHGTAVALTEYRHDMQARSTPQARQRHPHGNRPHPAELNGVDAMLARFAVLEHLAGSYVAGRWAAGDPTRASAPSTRASRGTSEAGRLEAALAAWDVQAHRTLAVDPDPADLVRVARVQALLAAATGVVTEAAAATGQLDRDQVNRAGPAVDAAQVAWTRAARRWAELTSPASRPDPRLIDAALEVRAAVAAAAHTPRGWAPPDQIAARIDLRQTVQTLHLNLAASIDLAYLTQEVAATHPRLTAPARAIAGRAQGEAEIAIDDGVTSYQGVTWVRFRDAAANRTVPLPDPVRRGLVNLADDVIAAAGHATAALAALTPSSPPPPSHRPADRPPLDLPRRPDLPAHRPTPQGPRR